ncbi:protein erfk [Flavobacterium subsaxonicum WB 4.1-42 = DSM 21790]|uniref:Protein erfk n=2 Tax=Flavobacterium TaxID=237 RepID=A0A0A2MYX9_9FLAO|nr:protein erfk [Flavobacterium subsaxonicum WB 4.1-42 = DSM 21790]
MKKRMLWILLLLPAALAAYYFYPSAPLPQGSVVDRLVVQKSKRKMEAYANGRLLKTYTIALGKNPEGHKQFEGDNRTPEGSYTINARNPNSGYHKNLGVSYPNESDLAHAQKLGRPAGGEIKIHGLRNGSAGYINKFHHFKDWTAGCIAVTNQEIDELYVAVKLDAIIEILP